MAGNQHLNDHDFDSAEQELRDIFRKVDTEVPGPSPYLKTRVLALYRERMRSHRKLFFWKLATFSGTVFGVAALAFVFLLQGPLPSTQPEAPVSQVRALVGQPMAIQLTPANLSANGKGPVHRVEVSLSDGIRFYSPNHPRVSQLKQIVLDREMLEARSEFPIIVRSDTEGLKIITIRFLNEEGQVLKERNLETTFYTRMG